MQPWLCVPSHISLVFISDEGAKAEPSSEDMQPDVVQEQTLDQLTQQQQPSQQKGYSGSSEFFGFEDLEKPEQPDLVDRCSQSSFTSQDGTGKHWQRFLKCTHTLQDLS